MDKDKEEGLFKRGMVYLVWFRGLLVFRLINVSVLIDLKIIKRISVFIRIPIVAIWVLVLDGRGVRVLFGFMYLVAVSKKGIFITKKIILHFYYKGKIIG